LADEWAQVLLIWTLTFGAIGIAMPLLLLIFRFVVFQSDFGRFEFLLWPSCPTDGRPHRM
jgi:hypothetical protein